MTDVIRQRRNLFLPNVFMEDCPNLFLDDESSDDNTLAHSLTSPDAKSDDSVEQDISEEYLDDLEDAIEDDEKKEPSEEVILQKVKDGNGTLPDLYEREDVIGHIINYDSIPDWFIDVDSWPKSTNLDCWNCNCKPRGVPWFIPLTETRKCVPHNYGKGFRVIDVSDATLLNLNSSQRYIEVVAMKTHGCFCTAYCAKRYLNRIKDEKIINVWQSNTLLKKLYTLITGRNIRDIPEALNKTIMIQHSGSQDGITAEEYRRRNELHAEEYL